MSVMNKALQPTHDHSRDRPQCLMCGAGEGDFDDFTARVASLQKTDKLDERFAAEDGVQVICSICNEGAKNVTQQKPSTTWLLSQVRRAGSDEQRAVRDWLNRKFGEG